MVELVMSLKELDLNASVFQDGWERLVKLLIPASANHALMEERVIMEKMALNAFALQGGWERLAKLLTTATVNLAKMAAPAKTERVVQSATAPLDGKVIPVKTKQDMTALWSSAPVMASQEAAITISNTSIQPCLFNAMSGGLNVLRCHVHLELSGATKTARASSLEILTSLEQSA
jgi:hypothetical protein